MDGKKKILLVSSAFYPEISPRSFRATELAKEFCRQGHEVTVLSKHKDNKLNELLKLYPLIFKMWREPLFPQVPKFERFPFNFLTRALSRFLGLFFEYPAIEEMFNVKKMLKNEEGYDLMISFAVPFPVHWGVALARSEKHWIAKRWIADCGDPYMFARLDTFKKPFYFKFMEVYFCRKCDYISIPFKEMQHQFYPEFLSKIIVVPQGFNFEDIRLSQGPENGNKLVFVFAGSVIPGKRDLALFFDFLATLRFDFLFIVYTNQKEWFTRYEKILGSKLQIKGYIERLSLLFEMSKADFLVNIDTVYDNQSNTEAIPSKLIDYALANRPILNINSSSLDKKLVLEFMSKNYSRQRIIEKSAFEIKNVSSKFLEPVK